jgi:hypothetical protein
MPTLTVLLAAGKSTGKETTRIEQKIKTTNLLIYRPRISEFVGISDVLRFYVKKTKHNQVSIAKRQPIDPV